MSGCAYVSKQVQDAGTFLGRTVGIVPDREEFTPEKQRAQATAVISPEQEYHIGRAVAARILARFKSDPNEDHQHYLQLIGAALISSGVAAETFAGYHFKVIESDNINAISAPGGYIFVTTGFLKALNEEDQLAAVLAHEISHVSRHHGIKMLQGSDDFSALTSLGLAAGNLNCAEALAQATVIFSHLVDNLIDTLLERGYSKDMEYEADGDAAALMKATGYLSGALLEALSALESAKSPHSGGWFSTHPAVEDRLQRLLSAGVSPVTVDGDTRFAARQHRFAATFGAKH